VPPPQVRVQVGASVLGNPNIVRRATLKFRADAGTDAEIAFDLSSRLTVDDPTPGGNIQNGVATMPAADFVRLGESKTLSCDIFGFDTTFSREQIEAIKAFGATLHLTPAPR
jgi:hypothetical protein